jgi:hypothetical protein
MLKTTIIKNNKLCNLKKLCINKPTLKMVRTCIQSSVYEITTTSLYHVDTDIVEITKNVIECNLTEILILSFLEFIVKKFYSKSDE